MKSKFSEIRVCQGLFCSETFSIRRQKQQYCSASCQQTAYRIRKYSLSPDQWWSLFEAQGRTCICGKRDEKTWHVDHDHSCCPYGQSCGKCVRGILCSSCNLALGHLQDDPDLLRRLADYLESSPSVRSVR